MKKPLVRKVLLPVILGIALVYLEVLISSGAFNIYKIVGFSMIAIILSAILLLAINKDFVSCGLLVAANCGTVLALVAFTILTNSGSRIGYDTIVIIVANWCAVTAVCTVARLADRNGRLDHFNIFFKIASAIFFVFYIMALIYALFLKTPGGGFGFMHRSLNLIPFKTIIPYITGSARVNLSVIIENLLGNLLLFLPLGFYMQVLSGRIRLLLRILIVLSVPLLVEVLQYITGIGSADIDDLILNFVGGMAGMAVCSVLDVIYRRRTGDGTAKLFTLN